MNGGLPDAELPAARRPMPPRKTRLPCALGTCYHPVLCPVGPHVREYCPDDFNELWRLDQDCFPPGIAYSRFELMHYIRRRGSSTLVAEEDGAIRGFVVFEHHSVQSRSAAVARSHVGHIITIDVHKDVRRSRFGTLLMDMAEARLRDAGSGVVFLEAAVDNSPAITFYKRRGYGVLRILPRYYQNKLDGLLMCKKLS